MLKSEFVKIVQILQELFEEKAIELNKVVIFGSSAKGKAKEDEDRDIDIIIVSKDFRYKDIFEKVRLARGVHRKLVKEMMKPFDIMYYSDLEWERDSSLIINIAKEEGEVIYTRK